MNNRFGRLSDQASIVMGQSPPGSTCNRDGVGIPLLNGPTEFGEVSPVPGQWTLRPARLANRDDVLYCVRGSSTGKINRADQRYAIGRGLAAIRGSEAAQTRYIEYLLRWKTPELLAQTTGSTFPNLSRPALESLPVIWQSLEEQRRIARVLGAFDDLIERDAKLVAESVAFVANLWRLVCQNELTISRPFFDVFEVEFGSPFSSDYFTKAAEGTPLIRIRDLKSMSPTVWTTESRKDGKLVQPGDVLAGMDAEFSTTIWRGRPAWLNQRVMRLHAKNGGPFVALLSAGEALATIQGYKTGTTVAHLNRRDLESTRVSVPADGVLAKLEAFSLPFHESVVSLSAEAERLRCTRDELLPLLMSGAIRVSEVEDSVP